MSGDWGPVVAAVMGAVAAAGAGGALTRIDDWYRDLRKPSWQPPNWLFGPVWTTIFGLAAWSFVIGWRHAGSAHGREILAIAFCVNLVLNAGWSFFFFFRRRPDQALREVVALWLSIACLMAIMGGISTLGAALLAPYLVWVGFAAYLNLTIVRLNGKFG